MKRMKTTIMSIVSALLFIFLMIEEPVMAIEEPDYDILESAEDFELRRYDSYIVAETVVEEAFNDAVRVHFRDPPRTH